MWVERVGGGRAVMSRPSVASLHPSAPGNQQKNPVYFPLFCYVFSTTQLLTWVCMVLQTKLSTEEEAADAEMKKLKSVQSARDCRRRKKAFIQSLQVRVKECEDREAQTQARIASLERELKQLQAARGEIHPATQAEATIIETLLAVDSTLDDEMLG